jgi:hypothetical protein
VWVVWLGKVLVHEGRGDRGVVDVVPIGRGVVGVEGSVGGGGLSEEGMLAD